MGLSLDRPRAIMAATLFCRRCRNDNILQTLGSFPWPTSSPTLRSMCRIISSRRFCDDFCCTPLGIVGIVFAAQVNGKLAAGDYAGAVQTSNQAKMWCWIAFGLGIVLQWLPVLAWIAFVIVAARPAVPRPTHPSTLVLMCDPLGGRGDFRRWLRWGAMLAAVLALCAGGMYLYVVRPRRVGHLSDLPVPCAHRALLPRMRNRSRGPSIDARQPLGGDAVQPAHRSLVAASCLRDVVARAAGRWPKTAAEPIHSGDLDLDAAGGDSLFWVLRNIPYYPFSLLAPHGS